MATSMKIATFNINNINCRLTNLLDWFKAARSSACRSSNVPTRNFRRWPSIDPDTMRHGRVRAPGMTSQKSFAILFSSDWLR